MFILEGIITIQDTRENLDKMKEWRSREASKIINQNNTEIIIDNIVDVTKSVVSFAGTVATVVMAICPFDGPAGEIATMLATPALVNAVEAGRGLLKGVFVSHDREQITASIADLRGNVKEISAIDKNMVRNVSQTNIVNQEKNNNMRL